MPITSHIFQTPPARASFSEAFAEVAQTAGTRRDAVSNPLAEAVRPAVRCRSTVFRLGTPCEFHKFTDHGQNDPESVFSFQTIF